VAKVTDSRGVEINKGDTVIYPGRSGSSVWNNIATVLDIVDSPATYGLPGTTLTKLRVQKTFDTLWHGPRQHREVRPSYVYPQNTVVASVPAV
jgi:hypothetical protein